MLARLASLQMILLEPNWLDGTSNHDYYISWRSGEPTDVHKFYSSKLALLKHPPYWIENDSSSAKQSKPKYLSWSRPKIEGVDESQVTYLCSNTPSKIHPEMDEIFLQILTRDPNSAIIFLRTDHITFDVVKDRLYRKLGEAFSRVIFQKSLSKKEAHTLLRTVDCCMDSFPICGMSSSFDALIMGIPIVTLPFDIPFGKWTAAIYEYIGVDGLVARSKEDYISLCLRLANDKEWKQEKSDEIKKKASILLENKESAKELEQFIIAAWERKKANLPNKDWILSEWK
jgi:predicted O-linked N-acetylglucosamine transferase (SPINDLY family)